MENQVLGVQLLQRAGFVQGRYCNSLYKKETPVSRQNDGWKSA